MHTCIHAGPEGDYEGESVASSAAAEERIAAEERVAALAAELERVRSEHAAAMISAAEEATRCMQAYMRNAHAFAYMLTRARKHAQADTHTHARTHMHAHTYACTYIRMRRAAEAQQRADLT